MPRHTRRQFIAQVPAALTLSRDRKVAPPPPPEWTLWYKQPAQIWTDALPIGNGRLGAMIFGGVTEERLQLNEDTLWSGFPRDWNNPHASEALPEIRKLVLEEKRYKDADKACQRMQGPYNESYQPLGTLHLRCTGLSDNVTNYRRELDLDTAIARVSFERAGVTYQREVFSSAPDHVIAIRLTASKPQSLNVTIALESPLHSKTEAEKNILTLKGKSPAHVEPNYVSDVAEPVQYSDEEGRGMRFECRLLANQQGGTITANQSELTVSNATEVIILLTAATGFRSYDRLPDRSAAEIGASCHLPQTSYANLRARHILEHQSYFRRVNLNLGAAPNSSIPTDQRLKAFAANEKDQHLLALYFQYGRYLLIASSRPGSQPANLQGIWNDQIRPPWSSNWTTNINTQMNYWLAETTNLQQCHQPLFDLVQGLSHTGAKTAEVNYQAPGWVSHHNVDLWRQSAPVGAFGKGDPTWANWQMSGPWFCAHLWDHYLFSGNKSFLEYTAYPILKGSAEFCAHWLIPGPDGKLTTCPSLSTENSFLSPDGQHCSTSAGCTMDIALIRELFTNCIAAAKILKKDEEFSQTLGEKLALLPEYKIGKYQQLQEWSEDFTEDQPGQRHMSHLYPVYPGSELTSQNKREFWQAARVSLERRLAAGGGYTGWSRAWVICLWARLLDGDLAHESLCRLLQHSTGPNLFDTHPAGLGWIFQIDGNFGGAAGLAELLLQSHEDVLRILPALPKAWPEGKVSGLRARGAIDVNIEWSAGRPKRVRLHSHIASHQKIVFPAQTGKPTVTFNGHPIEAAFSDGVLSLPMADISTYWITFS